MIVNLFLDDGFERLSNEFASFVEPEGFGGTEGFLGGNAFGGGFQVIEVSGGLFEEHFSCGFFGAFGA